MGWPGPMTHKQYLTWVAWLEFQWNIPTIDQHYFAEIRADIYRIFSKNPEKVKAQVIKFEKKTQDLSYEPEPTEHQYDRDAFDEPLVTGFPEERDEDQDEVDEGPPVVTDLQATMDMINKARWRLALKGSKSLKSVPPPSGKGN